MHELDRADIDAGVIELSMARVRPAGMYLLVSAAIGGLLGLTVSIIALGFAITMAFGANSGSSGPSGWPMVAVGVFLAIVYAVPVVPLVAAVYGGLQAMRLRSLGWARGAAISLAGSGVLMVVLVGFGTYCVALCPSMGFAVLALLAAGYLMGVLSDPQVRRAFDLSRMLDLEAEGAPEPGRRL